MTLFALAGLAAVLYLFSHVMSRRIARAHPPAGIFIDVEGARIHLVDLKPAGAVRGNVLLLHGASGNQADMVVPLAAGLLAAGFRVLAPDRPGHGWSSRPAGAAEGSPARQALLLVAALERAGVRQAIVVGHSWSGALATNLALDHAAFTRALVLLAPVTHPWPGGISWYYRPASLPLIGWLFTRLLTLPAGLLLMPAAIAEVFSPQVPPPDFVHRTGVRLVLRPEAFRANAQDVAGLYEFVCAQAPRLSEIAVPTAILAGDADKIVYTHIHSVQSHQEIRGASLRIVPGLGHSPHHAATEDVIATIIEVAGRVEGSMVPSVVDSM